LKGKQMKYALVDGERREAQPGLPGKCPDCAGVVIAKCGEVRVWHWAHWKKRDCDRWSEPETEWHRAWKNHFPENWQEISHPTENGETHRADVKTESGVVLEFQHSFLPRDEQESRENFYPKMVWVVNGRRRKRDRKQFFACFDARRVVNGERIVQVLWKEGALLREWGASRVPVYFDFGDSEPEDAARFDTPALWRLNPCGPNGTAYLSVVPKTLFLQAHRNGEPFEAMCTEAVERVAAHHLSQQAPRPPPLIGFERYMAKQRARRRRF
jgi:competence protein CoiA